MSEILIFKKHKVRYYSNLTNERNEGFVSFKYAGE